MIKGELAERVAQLTEDREPFVIATVVGSRRPTSVRLGDTALVLANGTIEGFIGGVCAQSSVRLYSMRALETGEPVLLRLVPEGDLGTEPDEALEDTVIEHNPCLSGGTLEIFLEPQVPAARVVIVGSSPIAHAIEKIAAAAGYDALRASADVVHVSSAVAAVVVASHGADEESVLAEALLAGVPYVALVASVTRGEAVRDGLEVPKELRAQLHTPAGLAIGAETPEEIAISILAGFIADSHTHPGRTAVATAVDPICGMDVAVTGATQSLVIDGKRVYFCGDGCRNAFVRQQAWHETSE
jgi:xanthine dehydrogenase accessory factor